MNYINNLKRTIYKQLDLYSNLFGKRNLINVITKFLEEKTDNIPIDNVDFIDDDVFEIYEEYYTKIIFDGSKEQIYLYVFNEPYLKILNDYVQENLLDIDIDNKDLVSQMVEESHQLTSDDNISKAEREFQELMKQMILEGYKELKQYGFSQPSQSFNFTDIDDN